MPEVTRTALVTGTSSGIGLKLAHHLLAENWRIIGCSRRAGKVDHPSYTHHTLDLTDETELRDFFQELVALEIDNLSLINNAGFANMNHFLLSPGATGKKMIEVNGLAAIETMRHYAKLLLKKNIPGGRIINFSSIAVAQAIPEQLWYAASKSALESATQVASNELSSMNVTVNCVQIPFFRSPMSGAIGKQRIEEMLNIQAIKRQCVFADISNAVDFFLSAKSDFVTGQTLALGGRG